MHEIIELTHWQDTWTNFNFIFWITGSKFLSRASEWLMNPCVHSNINYSPYFITYITESTAVHSNLSHLREGFMFKNPKYSLCPNPPDPPQYFGSWIFHPLSPPDWMWVFSKGLRTNIRQLCPGQVREANKIETWDFNNVSKKWKSHVSILLASLTWPGQSSRIFGSLSLNL